MSVVTMMGATMTTTTTTVPGTTSIVAYVVYRGAARGKDAAPRMTYDILYYTPKIPLPLSGARM
jgi:hypothetical protein